MVTTTGFQWDLAELGSIFEIELMDADLGFSICCGLLLVFFLLVDLFGNFNELS